ncbi:maleate cis-trans isomerase family protein [Mesorhizobium sp. 131-3-5]|uniref:maleate cis-trans isomerase family protein n=1 Tax=Mesorhizobium sp. 131-3-5 TaxID=2744520 RepID=UPI00192892ED
MSTVRSSKRIGMLVVPDAAPDAEIWKWCPQNVTPIITRLQIPETSAERYGSIDGAIGSAEVIQPATRTFISSATLPATDPDIVVLNCTSGSFSGGLEGERAIRRSILGSGASRALTTSGAVVGALTALRAGRVAVGTPYHAEANQALREFLTQAGFEVLPIPTTQIEDLDRASDDQVRSIAAAAHDKHATAMLISCTALPTRHLIPELNARYGMPVITALQATMWAALAQIDEQVAAPDHTLHSLGWPESVPLLAL